VSGENLFVRAVLPVLVGLCLIGLAVLVYRVGRVQLYNKFFAALYGLSGLKSASEGLAPISASWHASAPLFPGPRLWATLGSTCALLLVPLLVLFVLHFPRTNPWIQRRRAWAWLLFVPSAAVAVLLAGLIVGAVPLRVVARGGIAFDVWAVVATILAYGLLLHAWRFGTEALDRTRAGIVLLGFLPSFCASWFLTTTEIRTALVGTAAPLHDLVVYYLSPMLELLAACLVAYAILRYQLLGLEVRLKGSARYLLTTIAITTIVYLTSQFVENEVLQTEVFSFMGPRAAWIFSGIAAAALFKPMERLAGWMTSKIFPGASAQERRAQEIFSAQAAYVWGDGHATERELAFLKKLRGQLGLPEDVASRIEAEVQAKSLAAARP
jgi:hypothetical protein